VFGYAVSMSGDRAVIGAVFDDAWVADTGSAHVFHGLSDCQNNLWLDICDIAYGFSADENANGIPDECECPWDLDGDGMISLVDLLILMTLFGPCPDPCPPYCLGDFNEDCVVDEDDAEILAEHEGPCVPPAAACCMHDGSCMLLTEDDCTRLGVSWHPGATCDQIACPVPPDD
jgi:hypothetical protein